MFEQMLDSRKLQDRHTLSESVPILLDFSEIAFSFSNNLTKFVLLLGFIV